MEAKTLSNTLFEEKGETLRGWYASYGSGIGDRATQENTDQSEARGTSRNIGREEGWDTNTKKHTGRILGIGTSGCFGWDAREGGRDTNGHIG